jgi:hypothetical protein
MHAVTARLRKVPFHRVTTKPLRTPYTEWNTEPMAEVERIGKDDRKPIFTRRCDCLLACGMCNCAVSVWLTNDKNKWML